MLLKSDQVGADAGVKMDDGQIVALREAYRPVNSSLVANHGKPFVVDILERSTREMVDGRDSSR